MADKVQEPTLEQDGTVVSQSDANWEVFDEDDSADAVEKSLKETDAFGGNATTTAAALVSGRES